MRFDFTDDQRRFADTVDAALRSGPSTREQWDDPARSGQVWTRLTDVGLLGALVEERHGGAGASLVDVALAIEAVGRHAPSAPVAETVAAPLLMDLPRALASLVDGSMRVAAVPLGGGLTAHATTADAFLVESDRRVHLVPQDLAEVTPVVAQDRGLGLALVAARPTSDTEVGRIDETAATLHTVLPTVTALQLVGVAQRLVDMTRDHLLTREQFGRPIGGFQALKHRLADAAVAVETARGLAWRAAYAVAHEPEQASPPARLAKSAASAAADVAERTALQLHGGIGFTWEHDLHLHLQRARALGALHGTTSEHRVAVGRDYLEELA